MLCPRLFLFFFFFLLPAAPRDLHYPLRRQRQMCIRDSRTGNEFIHDELAGGVIFVGTDKDITVSGKLVSRQSAENEGVVLDFKSANSLIGFSNLAHDESAVGSNCEVLNRSIALDRQVAGGNIESTELVVITSNSADNSTGTGGRELAVFTNVHTLERDRLVLLDSNEVARAVELKAGFNRKSGLTGSKFNLAEAAGEGCVNTRHRSVLELFEFNAGELCSIGGRDLAVLENLVDLFSLDSDLVAEDDQAVAGKNKSILDIGNLIEASELTGGCLLYTSDAADEEDRVDLGGRRSIKKKKKRE